ncbi:MAG: EamA family transporter RarD [Pseudomonadota bacterium]
MASTDTQAAIHQSQTRQGVLAGVLAFGMWGAFPIYFKIATGVEALEMLAHRVAWAVPFGLLIILARKQWPDVKQILKTPRILAWLCASAAFISLNWLVYIWAVQHNQVFQASLGYYINPLLLVWAGFVFLGERLRRNQGIAVGFACIGVSILALSGGQVPWIALTLAVSFTVYGLVRKQVQVNAMPGLFVETSILFPVALAYLLYLLSSGDAAFGSNTRISGLLLLAGPLTVLPLLFFAVSARRLSLATIGFLQFIGPSGQFLVGLYYEEPLTRAHLMCFGFIWLAVAIFVYDAIAENRRNNKASKPLMAH